MQVQLQLQVWAGDRGSGECEEGADEGLRPAEYEGKQAVEWQRKEAEGTGSDAHRQGSARGPGKGEGRTAVHYATHGW